METTPKTPEPIIVERTFNAPITKVWEALTDVDKMRKWYFDVSAFEPVIGFEFTFSGGSETKTYLHKCKVITVESPHKLAYTWSYDGYEGSSLLTFELTEEGDQTHLKLTHTGLETFPNEPDFARTSFMGGWDYIINTSLKGYLE